MNFTHQYGPPVLGAKTPRQHVLNLLHCFPDHVINAPDEELHRAFLDMEAEEEIRNTAQVILEAKKWLRDNPTA